MSKRLRDNFDLRSKIPLDKRTKVQNLNSIDLPYEGLITYQKQDKKFYYYDEEEKPVDLFYKIRINAKEFGCVGNGLNDDTEPLSNLIDFIIENGGGALYIPTGIYKISSKIIKQISLTNVGIKIYGDGAEMTKIRWINEDGGFIFNLDNSTDDPNKLIIEDLTFETQILNGGTALKITGYTTSSYARTNSGCEIRNVMFKGHDATKQWTTCIDLYDCSQAYLINVHTKGANYDKTSPINYISFKKILVVFFTFILLSIISLLLKYFVR
jgi:hypothetical protein